MKLRFAAIGLIYCVLAGTAGQAQGLTQPWDEITPLTAEDRAMIRSTVETHIHGKSADTVAKWSNPASGHSGTITLLNKLTKQGMACERIQYQIMEPQSSQQHGRYVFTSCQLPDGSWKLAD
jgi:exopolyphosphatase/pppGpp-phosphohydrolase